MSYKIHPNEIFLTKMTPDELQLLLLEISSYNNSNAYLNALNDQLTRLAII